MNLEMHSKLEKLLSEQYSNPTQSAQRLFLFTLISMLKQKLNLKLPFVLYFCYLRNQMTILTKEFKSTRELIHKGMILN